MQVSLVKQLAALTLSAALVAGLNACAKTAVSPGGPGGNVIKIGVDLPLSGADASDGLPTANGARLAIDDANAQHLVPDFTLEADVLDDAVNGVHDPAQGAKNLQSFAADPSVLGVAGPFNSNVAKAEIPLSNSLQLALVSPANTNPTLTKGSESLALRRANPDKIAYFRVCTTDDVQGPAGAAFEFKTLKVRRAYVIDDNETYGKGVADAWDGTFRSLGGTVLGHDHITREQQDFHALLTRAAGLHPDVVFYGGTTSTGGGLVRKQTPDSGLGSVIYAGADGIQDAEFLRIAGSAAENSYATVAAVNIERLPSGTQFLKQYEAKYHAPVGPYSANAYVAAMTLVHAIAEAVKANGGKAPTRDQVLGQLRSGKPFTSITGTFSFDRNGDTTNKIIAFWVVKNGKWTFLSQENFTTAK